MQVTDKVQCSNFTPNALKSRLLEEAAWLPQPPSLSASPELTVTQTQALRSTFTPRQPKLRLPTKSLAPLCTVALLVPALAPLQQAQRLVLHQ